jgi:4-amino-4-deoxy-L-arabinose transferase-like glycosyltransferase
MKPAPSSGRLGSEGSDSFLLFIGALLCRIVASMGSELFGTDGANFLFMADEMTRGAFQKALSTSYHPLYPLLIAITGLFWGNAAGAGYVVSVVLGAGATVPLYLMIRRVFGRPVGVVGALMYALGPAVVHLESDVMTEGTFMFFLFTSMWLTWKVMEDPTLERGAALGLVAAAAFLTRAEGLLAVILALAWPLADGALHRERALKRAGAVALTGVVLLLLLSPYLFWVHSVRGRWALSVRQSLVSFEHALGRVDSGFKRSPESSASLLWTTYLRSLWSLSLYGALLPFYALGFRGAWKAGTRGLLFYLSYPIGLLGGILVVLRTHNFMTERYLTPGMCLMGALAGRGMMVTLGWAARRWPQGRWNPLAGSGLLLAVAVLPGLTCLAVRRERCRAYPLAARWIRSHGPPPRAISTPLAQVAYLSGSPACLFPRSESELRELVRNRQADYIVYSDKELDERAGLAAMMGSCEGVLPPVVIQGPQGSWKMYIHRVK